MEDDIKEYLENEFEFVKFDIKYKSIKLYTIIVELLINDNGQNKLIRTEFDYKWETHSTNNANLGQVKYYVNKSILKMFKKEEIK